MKTQTAGLAASGPVEVVGSLVKRVKAARVDSTERKARRKGPSVQERQAQLLRFYERYEDLVETLCDAAQYGPTPKLERSYAAHREWMHGEYGQMRPYLVAYLPSEAPVERKKGSHPRANDAFETLVQADNLDQFLAADDGGMISHIMLTRQALTMYGEHLRQLAARAA